MKPAITALVLLSACLSGCYTSYTVRTPDGHFERAVAVGSTAAIKKNGSEVVVVGTSDEKKAGVSVGRFLSGVIRGLIF